MFVKICGTTSEEDALLSVALGADALGFIFAPSTRQITPEHASDIIKRLPPEIPCYGVFRNASTKQIVQHVLASGVRGVQLHGMETPAEVAAVRAKLKLPVIKAVTASQAELSRLDRYQAHLILLDSANPGSGSTFDWTLCARLEIETPIVLAGGLTPANVRAAIESVRPWGVDVVSGVEESPGRKDPRKLRAFIERAKSATVVEGSIEQGHEEVSDQDESSVIDLNGMSTGSSPRQGPYDWEKDEE